MDTLLKAQKYHWPNIFQNPIALLLMVGTLIGFNFPLGKIAGNADVSPILWAMLLSVGVCMVLLPVLLIRGQLKLFSFQASEVKVSKTKMLRYVIVSALISFIIPNILVFSVIPHAGSGYTGLMFALSPVFTLALAVLFRLKIPNKIGVVGIVFGLLGAAIVSITRSAEPTAPSILWILAAVAIPIALACGNIYRTVDWPDNASADMLAFWSHLFSVMIFLVILLSIEGSIPINTLKQLPWVAVVQMIVAGMTFPLFFRLQQKGGPVLLSQIGYVAAAVGLISATLLLDERYSLSTWGGAGIIAIGIAITIISQKKTRNNR